MNKKQLTALRKADFYSYNYEWFDRGYLKEIYSNQKYGVFNLCGVCYLYVPFSQKYAGDFNMYYGYIFGAPILESVCRRGLKETYILKNSRSVGINYRLYENMMETRKEFEKFGYAKRNCDTDPDLEKMIIQMYKTQ